MIQQLNAPRTDVLAVEIIDNFDQTDERLFEKLFEQKLHDGHQHINLLLKIDHLQLNKIGLRALFSDGLYALRHIKNLGHIAIVGHSNLAKITVTIDGMIFNRAGKGFYERYFDISDLDQAWAFVLEDE